MSKSGPDFVLVNEEKIEILAAQVLHLERELTIYSGAFMALDKGELAQRAALAAKSARDALKSIES